MALVKRTISLTEQEDRWLREQVDAGLFASISEHIRELIQQEQESEEEIEAVRQKLIEAEKTPIVPFDPEEFKKEMKVSMLSSGMILSGY